VEKMEQTVTKEKVVKIKPYNPFAADIWCLGVCLWLLIFKEYPFLETEKWKYDPLSEIMVMEQTKAGRYVTEAPLDKDELIKNPQYLRNRMAQRTLLPMVTQDAFGYSKLFLYLYIIFLFFSPSYNVPVTRNLVQTFYYYYYYCFYFIDALDRIFKPENGRITAKELAAHSFCKLGKQEKIKAKEKTDKRPKKEEHSDDSDYSDYYNKDDDDMNDREEAKEL
ncbi:hypothetical protein RFI_06699, partial [Reticulomyxa filosa]